jgi:enoyl-CoA hydratase
MAFIKHACRCVALDEEVPVSLIVTETPAEAVGLIRLNNPARRNALSLQMRREVGAAIGAFAAQSTIRCIILTGDEKAFAAGADIAELVDAAPEDRVFEELAAIRLALDRCTIPVIAAVRGLALGGGCEVMMMCDIVIAGQSAKFGQPEVKVGIMPGAGGTQRLLRACGKAKALRWLLTGEAFDATTAEKLGIVSEIVPDDAVLDRSIELAKTIASLPVHAVSAIKEAVRIGANVPLDSALVVENRLFQSLFSTADQKEGMRAFLEKRAPIFGSRS